MAPEFVDSDPHRKEVIDLATKKPAKKAAKKKK
jgi:hypothetical protein